jgi:hypothetical protein
LAGDERLDRGEVDDRLGLHALADLLAEHPTQEGTATRVHPDHLPLRVDLGYLDLVGDDQSTTHEVDQVSREQIFGEQQFTGTSLESA